MASLERWDMSAWVAAGARRRGAAGPGGCRFRLFASLGRQSFVSLQGAGVALCSVSSAAAAATCDRMLYFQRQSRQPGTFKMPAFGRHLICGAPPCRMWVAGRRRRLPRRCGSRGLGSRAAYTAQPAAGPRPAAALQLRVSRCCAARRSSDVSLLCLGWRRASCLMMQYAIMCRVWRGGRLRGKQVRRSSHVRQPLPAIPTAGQRQPPSPPGSATQQLLLALIKVPVLSCV